MRDHNYPFPASAAGKLCATASANDELPGCSVAVALCCMQLCCTELLRVKMCAGIDQSLYVIFQPCCRSQEKRGVACSVAQVDRGSLGQKVAEYIDIIACRCEML